MTAVRAYNTPYSGENLNRVAFPMGGFGAGMICLEGTGAFSHVSVRNRPDVFNEPMIFAAVCIKGDEPFARVLEGPVPSWKVFGPEGSGHGRREKTYGLPRFEEATFSARFPFGHVDLSHPRIPLKARLTGWSPFIPGNADDASLPMAVLEYAFENPGRDPVEAVFSFHAMNFMATEAGGGSVDAIADGFVLLQPGSEERPDDEGAFSVTALDPAAVVDCAWFRGEWFDPLTLLWKTVSEGRIAANAPVGADAPSHGGSVYVPFALAAGETREVRLLVNWYVPRSGIRVGKEAQASESNDGSCCASKKRGEELDTYMPWYAGRFAGLDEVVSYCRRNLERVRAETKQFTDCFYDTTLPAEVVEAVAANLTILKSPTCLRQTDGRFWGWEGCGDARGSCAGSCTHVWNYAQAMPHLFPELERSLRRTEFNENQEEDGHQMFRAALPIRPQSHECFAASDGQLGGMMKVYREWRISGDTEWLRDLWPKVKASLDFCIRTWDPAGIGALVEPHHNTYDIEFWGPDGMCGSFYLGALRVGFLMAEALGEDGAAYGDLYEKGRRYLQEELYDGEYFIHKMMWEGLRAGDPSAAESVRGKYSPEAIELLKKEGPKYQYGSGCLSDGVLGAWIAECCGVGEILDADKVRSHLRAIHKYNLRRDLRDHANPQRPTYAVGKEGGLLLCSWPKGGALSLPFVYSNEVWTGIEYHVASHLMMMGCVEEGLEIVRIARDRYDGRVRNPFNEYEAGHWYARAMSSYGLIQGLTGIRYDAVDKVLHIVPKVKGDFRAFLCTATGYGTVGVKDGRPFCDVCSGEIAVETIAFRAAPG